MKNSTRRAFLGMVFLFLSLSFSLAASGPVPVIFDTDIGGDIDDAVALAILHAAQGRGEIRLLAVTLTNGHPATPAYVQMINAWYGYPDIPIGQVEVHNRPRSTDSYLSKTTQEAKEHFSWEEKSVETAVAVLRCQLASAEDRSVVIVQVGFSTNLADLLDSPADDLSPMTGKELAARKVKSVYVMGGAFTPELADYEECNIINDVPSAQKLIHNWPGEMIFTGFEIGRQIRLPGRSIESDYRYQNWHPIATSYRYFQQKFSPGSYEDVYTWDLSAVLSAVYPDRGFFSYSEPGKVVVRDNGTTSFTPDPNGNHRIFLLQTEEEITRALDAYLWLSSQPPVK